MISDLVKKVQAVAAENSTTILTTAGVVGTVATAFLSGRASWKAGQLVMKENERISEDPKYKESDRLDKMGTVKFVWPEYLPAVGVGGLTIASIIMSNRVSSKQIAAMATAYGLSERAFQEYKEKVTEKLGQSKETAVRDEIAQDRINATTPNQVIITGSGNVLCYDLLTDRYFESTVEDIKRAENTVNFEVATQDSVPLSRFYQEVGLYPTPYSDSVGWNIDNRCEVQISTVMSKDGHKPCVAVDFAVWPKPDYDKIWP